ncbi:MAG: hypothetical protein R2710_10300 [Acidimicrobiales bacterium]
MSPAPVGPASRRTSRGATPRRRRTSDGRASAVATEERLIAELNNDEPIDNEQDDIDALTDSSTGLFSESFFTVALDSRVAAARHLRPVAIILLEVVEGVATNQQTDADAELVAEAIRVTLREADTACRLRNGYFALLLEDTPRRTVPSGPSNGFGVSSSAPSRASPSGPVSPAIRPTPSRPTRSCRRPRPRSTPLASGARTASKSPPPPPTDDPCGSVVGDLELGEDLVGVVAQ